jgi:hypothetical protein
MFYSVAIRTLQSFVRKSRLSGRDGAEQGGPPVYANNYHGEGVFFISLVLRV